MDILRKERMKYEGVGETEWESFAKKYYADNSTKWENSDPLYYLCFSIIMLQTDIHNPNVKKKMSVQDYIKNLEKQNNGKNFDSLLLEDIYDTLKKKPFLFFNYDNSTMTQNDDISIKNFYMNIQLFIILYFLENNPYC